MNTLSVLGLAQDKVRQLPEPELKQLGKFLSDYLPDPIRQEIRQEVLKAQQKYYSKKAVHLRSMVKEFGTSSDRELLNDPEAFKVNPDVFRSQGVVAFGLQTKWHGDAQYKLIHSLKMLGMSTDLLGISFEHGTLYTATGQRGTDANEQLFIDELLNTVAKKEHLIECSKLLRPLDAFVP